MKLSPLIPLLFLAVLLRLPGIFLLSLTGDEISTIFQANFPFPFMISRLATMDVADADIAPPLYFIILHTYLVLFPLKVWAIRFISLGFDVATIVVTYFWIRSIVSPKIAIYAGLFLAGSPFLAWYAGEIRMYALLPFFSVLSTAAIIGYLQQKQRKYLVLYFFSACCAIYTQYYFFLLLAAQGITGLLFGGKKRIFPLFFVFFLVFCSFLPWVPALLTDLKILGTNSFPIPNGSFVTFFYIIIKLFLFGNRFFVLAYPLIYVVGGFILSYAVLMLFKKYSQMATPIKMVTTISAIVIFFLSIIAFLKPETLRPHATIFLVPLVLIVLAYLLHDDRTLSKTARVVLLLIWGSIFWLYNYNPLFTKPPYKKAAEMLCIENREQYPVYNLPLQIPCPPSIFPGSYMVWEFYLDNCVPLHFLQGNNTNDLLTIFSEKQKNTSSFYLVFNDYHRRPQFYDDFMNNLLSDYHCQTLCIFPSNVETFPLRIDFYTKRDNT